jgi:hypothetical protein
MLQTHHKLLQNLSLSSIKIQTKAKTYPKTTRKFQFHHHCHCCVCRYLYQFKHSFINKLRNFSSLIHSTVADSELHALEMSDEGQKKLNFIQNVLPKLILETNADLKTHSVVKCTAEACATLDGFMSAIYTVELILKDPSGK